VQLLQWGRRAGFVWASCGRSERGLCCVQRVAGRPGHFNRRGWPALARPLANRGVGWPPRSEVRGASHHGARPGQEAANVRNAAGRQPRGGSSGDQAGGESDVSRGSRALSRPAPIAFCQPRPLLIRHRAVADTPPNRTASADPAQSQTGAHRDRMAASRSLSFELWLIYANVVLYGARCSSSPAHWHAPALA
jgi:hypothetical protein